MTSLSLRRSTAWVTDAFRSVRRRFWEVVWAEPEDVLYAAKVGVWLRWFSSVVFWFVLLYRPIDYPTTTLITYIVTLLTLAAVNGLVHYRLLSWRRITWHWMLLWSAGDVILITSSVWASGGFSHFFHHLLYYPALASFAVVFSSVRFNLAWVSLVAALYATICLTTGNGIDLEARDDKTLVLRIFVMYALVAVVNFVSRFERARRRQAVARERALQEEQLALSRFIHDTAAQSAYMVGIGIENAMEIAGESNRALTESLRATRAISISVIWELRHPIDVGLIYEGQELDQALRSHAARFTRMTSIPVEVAQSGTEPDLSPVTRSLLFSIAHNALTNALRHAGSSRILIDLAFGEDSLRMSVSDDGAGLPDDYAQRGHGFRNMDDAAGRAGGYLEVAAGPDGIGTTVSCVIPVTGSPGSGSEALVN